jgi:hypothetical protein
MANPRNDMKLLQVQRFASETLRNIYEIDRFWSSLRRELYVDHLFAPDATTEIDTHAERTFSL